MFVMGELSNSFNMGASLGKSGEDSSDISTILHGDDSELIFFVNPDKEGLLIVMEDTSAFRPFSVEITSFQESVSLLEEEVIIDELFSLSLT
jgi:hypothetical protein